MPVRKVKKQTQSSLFKPPESEAYQQYVAVFGDVLYPKQKELLIAEVTEKRITKTAWVDALQNWKLCGYSPRNIAGMVEYACARPAGNRGPVVRTQAEEHEPDIESVVVRPPKRTFEWDT